MKQLFTEISGVCVILVKNWKGETISFDMMKLQSKAQYFQSFKVSYDPSYKASQMFCFDYTVL